jgi:site-specific DNA-cytosine methylase
MYFVLENVRTLASHDSQIVLKLILSCIIQLGYETHIQGPAS